jgi:hypothetical protein
LSFDVSSAREERLEGDVRECGRGDRGARGGDSVSAMQPAPRTLTSHYVSDVHSTLTIALDSTHSTFRNWSACWGRTANGRTVAIRRLFKPDEGGEHARLIIFSVDTCDGWNVSCSDAHQERVASVCAQHFATTSGPWRPRSEPSFQSDSFSILPAFMQRRSRSAATSATPAPPSSTTRCAFLRREIARTAAAARSFVLASAGNEWVGEAVVVASATAARTARAASSSDRPVSCRSCCTSGCSGLSEEFAGSFARKIPRVELMRPRCWWQSKEEERERRER